MSGWLLGQWVSYSEHYTSVWTLPMNTASCSDNTVNGNCLRVFYLDVHLQYTSSNLPVSKFSDRSSVNYRPFILIIGSGTSGGYLWYSLHKAPYTVPDNTERHRHWRISSTNSKTKSIKLHWVSKNLIFYKPMGRSLLINISHTHTHTRAC